MQPHTPSKTSRVCETCGVAFLAASAEVKRGNGKFCSRRCSTSRKRQPPQPNQVCALCGGAFFRAQSKASRSSKSGLLFCCRAHKDAAQRLGGLKEIQPSHYGTGKWSEAYRALAFANFPHRCVQCGYKRVPAVLHVHHKDGNNRNNALANLELRCPTCHVEWHYLRRDHAGPWKLINVR